MNYKFAKDYEKCQNLINQLIYENAATRTYIFMVFNTIDPDSHAPATHEMACATSKLQVRFRKVWSEAPMSTFMGARHPATHTHTRARLRAREREKETKMLIRYGKCPGWSGFLYFVWFADIRNIFPIHVFLNYGWSLTVSLCDMISNCVALWHDLKLCRLVTKQRKLHLDPAKIQIKICVKSFALHQLWQK